MCRHVKESDIPVHSSGSHTSSELTASAEVPSRRAFPGATGDMFRILSSMTEITCAWKNSTPSTHRGLKTGMTS